MLPIKTSVFISLAVFCVLVAVCVGWHVLPVTAKAGICRLIPVGGSYREYERLARFLRLGMTEEEVRKILGKPQSEKGLKGGKRWVFFDDGPTAGWTCVVDFASEGDSKRLSYFFNVGHILFTNSPHQEFGVPLDNGLFENDPLLKIRRDEWYTNASAN